MLILAVMLAAAPESCAGCHAERVQSYRETAHHRASMPASAETIRGSFEQGRNVLRTAVDAVYFLMERRGDAFYQTGIDRARSRSERFDFVIGSGRRGQSYLYGKNGALYQLPVSFLALTGDWINSPGYPDGKIFFDRAIPRQCLDCHMTAADAGRFTAGIGCAKCHGTAEKHPEIRSPARLDRDRQVAVCAACHSGLAEAPKADVHGNQVGLLQQSRCYRASPRMSCSTCHDVHRVERDVVALSARCGTCHAAAQCKQASRADNCIDCHMPRQKSQAITFQAAGRELAQTYRTHRIGIYR
jgi:hypothetical protein